MLSIFSCACWLSVCLLWRSVYLGHLPVFWLAFFVLYCVIWAVDVFGKLSPVCHIFCRYFLPVRMLSFCLFMVSFVMQKFISLVRSHLFIFGLFLLLWETDLRKHCCDLCQRMFCPCSLLGILWWVTRFLFCFQYSVFIWLRQVLAAACRILDLRCGL